MNLSTTWNANDIITIVTNNFLDGNQTKLQKLVDRETIDVDSKVLAFDSLILSVFDMTYVLFLKRERSTPDNKVNISPVCPPRSEKNRKK